MSNLESPIIPQRNTSNRGFASMDHDKQRAIASKGGQAAHQSGRAHEFDSREAAEAGRKGGVAVSRNRQHMAEIGAMGGRARGLAYQERLRQQAQTQAQSQASGSQTQTISSQTPPLITN